ncbi:MAG: zinc-dependent alcohol dehydrogenase family protein [Desulfurococcaceae archaeon]
MKAMVLYKQMPIENNPLKYEEIDTPIVKNDNDVLIEVKYCGVCRTDLHIVEGELEALKLPLIPGHQIIGVIKETGREVDNVSKGERVGLPWLYWACGTCKFCKRDLENLCDRIVFTGYSVDGGYAEYIVANKDFVHKIPKNFNDHEAAPLMCAGAIGYRALRLTGLVEKRNGILGIFGFGSAGQLVLKTAKAIGLKTYVFTHSSWKKELAYKMGADWAGETSVEIDTKLDAAIVFAPVSWVLVEALKKTERGGRIVIGEIYMNPIEKLDYKLIWLEKEIKTVANVTRRDVREFLEIASKYNIIPDVEIYRLEDANKALTDLKHNKIRGQAVLKIK